MTRLPLAALALAALAGAATAQTAPPRTSLDNKPGTLSDNLGDTNGVIKPKGDVDPDMHKATPQAGTMPVIKPGQVPPQSGNGAGKGAGQGGLH